jgi:hypothetical protein
MRMVDVKGAYLNGELKEEIYIKQPEGFSDGTSRQAQPEFAPKQFSFGGSGSTF